MKLILKNQNVSEKNRFWDSLDKKLLAAKQLND
jgi:hypothetical protein